MINLLFKTYFRLNATSLSRNVLKALTVYKGDMPPLDAFPPSQQVTFKYYEGVLSFLEENYVEASRIRPPSVYRWSLTSSEGGEASDRGVDALPQGREEE